jgi:peptide/nickel transport system substrate-binding protein
MTHTRFCRPLVLGLLLMCSGSCGEHQIAPSGSETLRIGVGLRGSARTPGMMALAELLYTEPLLAREWDGRLSTRIAETWEWEEDGSGLRIVLRPGVKFHDGTTLTAGMVAAQLESRIAKDGGPAAPGFQNVKAIRAINEQTLLFRVSQPDLLLLAVLADIKITKPGAPDVSTGPFKLARKVPTPVVERFEEYHRGRAGVARVEIVPYDTQRATWAALLRGQVDAVQEIDRDAVEFLAGNTGVRTYSSLQPFYIPLVFNLRHPILAKRSVRRALRDAVDAREIITRVLRGKGAVATAPVWPYHWAHGEVTQPFQPNPERARSALDAAGLPERQVSSGPPRRFTINCLVWGESPLYEQLALLLQRQLYAVGVNLEIQFAALEDIGKRAQTGNFEAYILPTNSSRTLERTYRLWRSKSPENPDPAQDSGYTGADLWLDRLRQSTSEPQTREALIRVIKAFHEDAPAIFIAWLEVTRAVDARFVVGETDTPDPFQALWHWRAVGAKQP